MKKLVCLITLVSCIAISAFAQTTTQNYNFGKITKIDASFIFKINLTEGNSKNVKIVCPDKLVDDIIVSYSFGELKLSKKNTNRRFVNRNNEKIEVYLQMEKINSIDLSGASELIATGYFYGDDVEIDCSGASSIVGLKIKGDEAELDFSGASNVELDGEFNTIELDASGASNGTLNLNGNYMYLDCSGASGYYINGNIKKITADISGASKTKMIGRTDYIKADVSGASSFDGKELKSIDGYAEASGASKCVVNVSNNLTVSASAASKIIHYGNPNIIDESRSKQIIKGD
jgi:Protein of unknown function (DUF2807).